MTQDITITAQQVFLNDRGYLSHPGIQDLAPTIAFHPSLRFVMVARVGEGCGAFTRVVPLNSCQV